jgi:hypothetical protein
MNWTALLSLIVQLEHPVDQQAAAAAIRREGAYGPAQIRAPCLHDVNTRYSEAVVKTFGRKLTLQDCTRKDVALWTTKTYLEHWGQAYTQKTGKKPTAEIYCRIWNGGPDGWREKQTVKYWHKARTVIKEKGLRP